MKKILKATIRETDDEFHIECRFLDGQKFSAVTVDKAVPGAQNLAMTGCWVLQEDFPIGNNLYLVKSNTREKLEVGEIISGIQPKTEIHYFEVNKQCEDLKEKIDDIACCDDCNTFCFPKQEIAKERDRYKQALEKSEEILQQDYVELSDISKVINEVKE